MKGEESSKKRSIDCTPTKPIKDSAPVIDKELHSSTSKNPSDAPVTPTPNTSPPHTSPSKLKPTPTPAPLPSGTDPHSDTVSVTCTRPSYASTTAKNLPPSTTLRSESKSTDYLTKENAVIFPYITNLTYLDYLNEVAKLVPPNDIIYASRISNNRMNIYFSSKTWVDIVTAKKGINTKIGFVPVRRLLNPHSRLIISNVMPGITNETIIKAIEPYVTPVSAMQFVAVGLKDPKFQHIKSFRRQIYITTEDDSKNIPESLLIQHEGDEVRIFLTLESNKCYRCQSSNHQAKECPKNESFGSNNPDPQKSVNSRLNEIQNQHLPQLSLSTSKPTPNSEKNSELKKSINEKQQTTQQKSNDYKIKPITTIEEGNSSKEQSSLRIIEQPAETSNTKKRRKSKSPKTKNKSENKNNKPNTTPSSSDLETSDENSISYPQKQRMKFSAPSELFEKSLGKAIDKQKFHMDQEQVLVMLKEVKGKREQMKIIHKYTDQTDELANVLATLLNNPLDQKTKGRLSRLISTIKASGNDNTSSEGEEEKDEST